MRLKDKTALITGAAGGLGRAAAELFAMEGARVVITDINEEDGLKAAAAIRQGGGSAMFIAMDVTDPQSVENAMARTVQEFGRLDILYNNAGGSTPQDNKVTEASIEAFWKTIKVDLFGTWLCCRYGIPEMIKFGGGVVINTSSLVAMVGYAGKDAYTAAKGAIASLTRSMAVEYAPYNIRVNALAPGVTLTDRLAGRVAENKISSRVLERHLLGLLKPAQIARAALFLASDEASGMTGQVMRVDGGATIA